MAETLATPLLIDGVYEAPDAVRAWALSLDFVRRAQVNYAGAMTLRGFGAAEMAHLLGSRVGRILRPHGKSGRFRLTVAEEQARRTVHADAPPISWAAVVYLGPAPGPLAGTRFYESERGLRAVPESDVESRQLGFQDRGDAIDTLVGGALRVWHEVPWRNNRLVAYPSYWLHAPGPAFGADATTGAGGLRVLSLIQARNLVRFRELVLPAAGNAGR